MRAVVIREPGGPEVLEIRDVPDPTPQGREVVVAVHATALNRADLLQRRGLYPPPPGATDILGLECAGVVERVGPDVTRARPGERVMALLPGGGYAEQVAVPEDLLIPVPEGMSLAQAAAVPEAFLTAREALFTLGRLEAGQVVLIHAAAGGVGSAAVQLARAAGATVVATAGSAEKLERVRALGAQHLINYRSESFVEAVDRASEGRGADVVVDFVGAPYWEQHARCLAVGGRNVVVGVMGGAKATVDLGVVLRKRLQLLGLVMRSRPLADKIAITRAFVRESLPHFASGRLAPIVDRVVPLADVSAAHQQMEANENVGKIVLAVRGDAAQGAA